VLLAHPALFRQGFLREVVDHARRIRVHVERQRHMVNRRGRDPSAADGERLRLRQRRVDEHTPQRPLGRPALESVDHCEESKLKLIGLV